MEYQSIAEALEIIFSQKMDDLDDYSAFCAQYLYKGHKVRFLCQNNGMKLYVDDIDTSMSSTLDGDIISIDQSHPMSQLINLLRPLEIYNSKIRFRYQFSLKMTIEQFLKFQCYALKELISLFIIHHALGRTIDQRSLRLFVKIEGFSQNISDQLREAIDSRLERYIMRNQFSFYNILGLMGVQEVKIEGSSIKSLVSVPIQSNALSDTQKTAIWYAFMPRLLNKYMNESAGFSWETIGFKIKPSGELMVLEILSTSKSAIEHYERLSKFPNSFKNIQHYLPDKCNINIVDGAPEPMYGFNLSEIRETLQSLCDGLSTIINQKLIFSDNTIISTALKYMCNQSFYRAYPLGLSPSMADYSWWASMYPLRSKIKNMFRDNRLFFQHTSQHLWDGVQNHYLFQKESWLYWVTILFNEQACNKSHELIETAHEFQNESFELILSQLAYVTSVVTINELNGESIDRNAWLQNQAYALKALFEIKYTPVSEIKNIVDRLFMMFYEGSDPLSTLPQYHNVVMGFLKLVFKLQAPVITDLVFSSYQTESLTQDEHIELMKCYLQGDLLPVVKYGQTMRSFSENIVNSFRTSTDEVAVIPGYHLKAN